MKIGIMGNQASAIDPVHTRIYYNMIQIQDPLKRIQMIQTCFSSMEYVNSAKRSSVYSYLLHYISTIQSGGNPPLLPGEHHPNTQHTVHTQHNTPSAIPRSLQQIPSHAGPGATHPSLLNANTSSTYSQQQRQQNQIITHTDSTPSWKVINDTPKQKAISYFSSCLEVLNIQE